MAKKSTSIACSIKRFHKLRMHSDKKFRRKLQALQAWKTDQLLASYATMMADKRQRALLNFYFREIFSGIDLSELKSAKSTQKVIDRFFSGTQMLTVGMEYNALTCEIDQALTETLFEELAVDTIDAGHYLQACHQAQLLPALERQLQLFELFATDLNETVEDRVIVASVKMAAIPARVAGFRNMHQLISDGLKYARAVDDAQGIAMQVLAHERSVLDNIRSRSSTVFYEVCQVAA